ncbi:hypothetical protein PSAB6_10048 [Paraburkholderia sabiae]|nr:hypothetical protein PSAB6_10048 [Paraburkholderia sabiae]
MGSMVVARLERGSACDIMKKGACGALFLFGWRWSLLPISALPAQCSDSALDSRRVRLRPRRWDAVQTTPDVSLASPQDELDDVGSFLRSWDRRSAER